MVALVLQATGLLMTAVGAGIWFLPAGFIVAGIGLVAMGIAVERSK